MAVMYVLKNHWHKQVDLQESVCTEKSQAQPIQCKDQIQLIDRTLVPNVSDLQESGFATKWTEMDRNKYIIGNGVWSVIEQPTNYVK